MVCLICFHLKCFVGFTKKNIFMQNDLKLLLRKHRNAHRKLTLEPSFTESAFSKWKNNVQEPLKEKKMVRQWPVVIFSENAEFSNKSNADFISHCRQNWCLKILHVRQKCNDKTFVIDKQRQKWAMDFEVKDLNKILKYPGINCY